VPFFFVFFCFCCFNKEKARKEIVTSPQKGKNWTIVVFNILFKSSILCDSMVVLVVLLDEYLILISISINTTLSTFCYFVHSFPLTSTFFAASLSKPKIFNCGGHRYCTKFSYCQFFILSGDLHIIFLCNFLSNRYSFNFFPLLLVL
jgi:hypothetical protein